MSAYREGSPYIAGGALTARETGTLGAHFSRDVGTGVPISLLHRDSSHSENFNGGTASNGGHSVTV